MDAQTHYIAYFTRANHRGMQQAVCGNYVKQGEHSNEPTCAKCKAYLTFSESLDTAMAEMSDRPHEFDETDLALGKEL